MEYKVKTKDGYVLTLFRIPSVGAKKEPVFMLHGVQSTAGIYVGLGKDSLGRSAFPLFLNMRLFKLVFKIVGCLVATNDDPPRCQGIINHRSNVLPFELEPVTFMRKHILWIYVWILSPIIQQLFLERFFGLHIMMVKKGSS